MKRTAVKVAAINQHSGLHHTRTGNLDSYSLRHQVFVIIVGLLVQLQNSALEQYHT